MHSSNLNAVRMAQINSVLIYRFHEKWFQKVHIIFLKASQKK
jgi:hypothetical protein